MNAGYNQGAARSRWRIGMWGSAAALLLLPLVAMQFTAQVQWDVADFVAMGALLGTACGLCELAARSGRPATYRYGVAVAVLAAFLLAWINLAVGMIGAEGNPLNLLYALVIAVAVLGCAIARFRPGGMARAFVAAAAVQALVGAVALAAGTFTLPLEAFFMALWLAAAALMRNAAAPRSAV